MPEFGYASKYSPVGWKATVPVVADKTDLVAIIGDMIVGFYYDQQTQEYVCDNTLQVANIWPAMPNGGVANYGNWYCAPINTVQIYYTVSGTPYYLTIYPTAPFKQAYNTGVEPSYYWHNLSNSYRPCLVASSQDNTIITATYTHPYTLITTASTYAGGVAMDSKGKNSRQVLPTAHITTTPFTEAGGLGYDKSTTPIVVWQGWRPNSTLISTPKSLTGSNYVVLHDDVSQIHRVYTTVKLTGIEYTDVGWYTYPTSPTTLTTSWATNNTQHYCIINYTGLSLAVLFDSTWTYVDVDCSPSIVGNPYFNLDINNESTSSPRGMVYTPVSRTAINERYYSRISTARIEIPASSRTAAPREAWGWDGTRWTLTAYPQFSVVSNEVYTGFNLDLYSGEIHAYSGATIDHTLLFLDRAIYLPNYGLAEHLSPGETGTLMFYKWPDRSTVVASVSPIVGSWMWDSAKYTCIQTASTETEPASTKHLFSIAFTGGMAYLTLDTLDAQIGTATFIPFMMKLADDSRVSLNRAWVCVGDISSDGMCNRQLYDQGWIPTSHI